MSIRAESSSSSVRGWGVVARGGRLTPDQAAQQEADRDMTVTWWKENRMVEVRDIYVRAFLKGVEWLREQQIHEMTEMKAHPPQDP